MDPNQEIQKASLPKLISWWAGENLPDWATATALLHEKVASALRRVGPNGIRFLKTQIESGDLRKRAVALRALSNKETCDDEVVSFLIDAFRVSSGLERQAADGFKELAMNSLINIEQYPLDRSEVEPLLEHRDKYLAATAMVYLSHAVPDETIGILRSGLRHANPIRRGYACTQAGFRNIHQLKHEVSDLLKDSDQFVSRSARIACEMFDLVSART